MRILIVAIALAVFSTVGNASPLPDYPFVYVLGEAKREVAPDKANITFQIKSHHAQAEEAYKKQADVADVVISFAGKLGVAADNIVGGAIEKSAVRKEDERGRDLEIIGYDASRSVTIELKELSKFPELIEFLYTQQNVENIHVNFGSKDMESILQGLTAEAARSAKANAQRLSAGFEQKLGKVRAISESGFSGLSSPFGFRGDSNLYTGASAGGRGKRDFRAIPATISFRKSVYAIFALE